MPTFLQDLRYAARMLLKSPGFTLVAVLTLALGIGANTAIFSFIDAALLKPLPYGEPERILMVLEKPPGGGRNGISTLNFLDWKNQNTVFEGMAAVTGRSMTMSGGNEPVRVGVWQRLEQRLVDEAENRRVRPDPERQRQDRDHGEDRLLAKRPERESDVLHGCLDVGGPRFV